jgi:hypothetical protein
MARYLRYVAAVVFALLALAFVALWVRSYYYLDRLHVPLGGPSVLGCGSYDGIIACGWGTKSIYAAKRWHLGSQPHSEVAGFDFRGQSAFLGFNLDGDGFSHIRVTSPHWFLAALSLALAARFAFKRTWRFTTRGLPIATMLVAVILGLAAYALS